MRNDYNIVYKKWRERERESKLIVRLKLAHAAQFKAAGIG